MPTNNNSRGANRSRRSKNNNPQGHNQYNSGWMDSARERPMAAAAAAAAAVGAGVFLWSKRGQISEQLGQLSEQIGEWTENLSSEREFETVGGETRFTSAPVSATDEFGTAPTPGSVSSGTMSGGPLDTGPSGRGLE